LFDIPIGSTAKAILSSLSCDALVEREPRSVVEGENLRATAGSRA
jgi:hypothetical protein